MKARERQDLKKNELMDSLERIRFFFEEHGSKILAVAVVILVVIAAAFYFINNREAARVQAWEQLLSSRTGRSAGTKADDLRTLAQTAPDRQVAAFAWKERGDLLLTESMMGEQAGKSTKDLRTQAQQAYDTVISQYSDVTLAAAGAEIGLATLAEETWNWENARKIYQKISADKSLAGTGIPEIASARLAVLGTFEKWSTVPLATTKPVTTTKATTQKS
jgi:hypothetical protein